MIAPAAVSNDALVDPSNSSLGDLAQAHEELVRLLMSHGELVHADSLDRDAFIASVRALMSRAPDAGKFWEAMLSHGRWGLAPAPAPKAIAEIEDLPALKKWSTAVRVAFMEKERAELLGCPENELSWRILEPPLEIACCVAGWQTDTFRDLRELSEQHTITPKTDRDALAMTRLVPLLQRARSVTVLDRWLGKNLSWQYHRGRHVATSASTKPPELAWLMQIIDRHAQDATLSLFSTFDDEASDSEFRRSDVVAAVDDLWQRVPSRGGLGRLQLFLADDNVSLPSTGARFPHDRHIRCDSAGFSLSAGIDRLRRQETGNGTWRMFYLWQPGDVQGLRDDENVARVLGGAPEVWE